MDTILKSQNHHRALILTNMFNNIACNQINRDEYQRCASLRPGLPEDCKNQCQNRVLTNFLFRFLIFTSSAPHPLTTRRRLASSLYSRAAFYARNGAGQAHALSSGIVSHVDDGEIGNAYNADHGNHDGHEGHGHADHDNHDQHGSPQQQQEHADPRAIQRQVYAHMSPTQTRFASEHGGVAGGPSVLDLGTDG
jgi:hypothetical protein